MRSQDPCGWSAKRCKTCVCAHKNVSMWMERGRGTRSIVAHDHWRLFSPCKAAGFIQPAFKLRAREVGEPISVLSTTGSYQCGLTVTTSKQQWCLSHWKTSREGHWALFSMMIDYGFALILIGCGTSLIYQSAPLVVELSYYWSDWLEFSLDHRWCLKRFPSSFHRRRPRWFCVTNLPAHPVILL